MALDADRAALASVKARFRLTLVDMDQLINRGQRELLQLRRLRQVMAEAAGQPATARGGKP